MTSEKLHVAIANSNSGYIEAAAGCGKTEAIVQSINKYTIGKTLVLTHTNAGVHALIEKFRKNKVSVDKYEVITISSWAWKWVRKYPKNASYQYSVVLPPESEHWVHIYVAALSLFKHNFAALVLKNTYSNIMVDEYQDCTVSMHNFIMQLKNYLPCRALGDPLQSIFDFNEELVSWERVINDFKTNLGELSIPHRWYNRNQHKLGDWLIQSRDIFKLKTLPSFNDTPINIIRTTNKDLGWQFCSLVKSLDGSICVIGQKTGKSFESRVGSLMINNKFYILESNDLPKIKKLVLSLTRNDLTLAKKCKSIIIFIKSAFSPISTHVEFIEKALMGLLSNKLKDPEKLSIYTKHANGYSPQLLIDILTYLNNKQVKCLKLDSVLLLSEVLKHHVITNDDIFTSYLVKISEKSHYRRHSNRVAGSTLLLKGLEFDHAIILYNNTYWENPKLLNDLYVALTRACISVHLLSY